MCCWQHNTPSAEVLVVFVADVTKRLVHFTGCRFVPDLCWLPASKSCVSFTHGACTAPSSCGDSGFGCPILTCLTGVGVCSLLRGLCQSQQQCDFGDRDGLWLAQLVVSSTCAHSVAHLCSQQQLVMHQSRVISGYIYSVNIWPRWKL